MKSSLRILHVIAIGAALSCATRASADAININFAGSFGDAFPITTSKYDPGTSPNTLVVGPAGVDTTPNGSVWNNLVGFTSNNVAIGAGVGTVTGAQANFGGGPNDQMLYVGQAPATSLQEVIGGTTNGTSVTVPTTVLYNSQQTLSNGIADNNLSGSNVTQNGLLLNNYLDGSRGAPGSVTVSNIPAGISTHSGGYELTVYVAGSHTGSATDRSDYNVAYTSPAGSQLISPVTGTVYAFSHGSSLIDTVSNNITFEIPQGVSTFTLTANSGTNVSSPIDGLSISTAYVFPSGGGGTTPEPGSLVLMGLGALGLAVVARRRIRKAA